MGFLRRESWGGWPFPAPADLPDPWIKPAAPALGGGFLTAEQRFMNLLHLILQGKGISREMLFSPELFPVPHPTFCSPHRAQFLQPQPLTLTWVVQFLAACSHSQLKALLLEAPNMVWWSPPRCPAPASLPPPPPPHPLPQWVSCPESLQSQVNSWVGRHALAVPHPLSWHLIHQTSQWLLWLGEPLPLSNSPSFSSYQRFRGFEVKFIPRLLSITCHFCCLSHNYWASCTWPVIEFPWELNDKIDSA